MTMMILAVQATIVATRRIVHITRCAINIDVGANWATFGMQPNTVASESVARRTKIAIVTFVIHFAFKKA